MLQIWRKQRRFSTAENVWTPKVGLEIHAQIKSTTKLFSGAATNSDRGPNSCVDLFDIALPGVLPVLNRTCVEYGLLTALATECAINPVSSFDRKHYFYPDLPAGFQITQQRVPLAQDGKIIIKMQADKRHSRDNFEVRISRVHLEQDSAKIVIGNSNATLLDYNRAGVGLMEIVTAPDMRNGVEAAACVKEILLLLKTLNVCDCRMEDGSFRVDVNVSVHKNGKPAPRVEVKNISGTSFINKAVSYEIKRQTGVYETGGEVEEETRMFDNLKLVTYPTREKGKRADYRFLPEPDLPSIWVIDSESKNFHIVSKELRSNCIDIATVRKQLVELPREKRLRIGLAYGLMADETENLITKDGLLEYFEKTKHLKPKMKPKLIYQWMTYVVGVLTKEKLNLKDSRVTPELLHDAMRLCYCENRITKATANAVLDSILKGDCRSPDKILKEDGLQMITDPQEIESIINKVLEENPDIVDELGGDRDRLENIVRGKVIKKSAWRADPRAVQNVVTKYFN